MKFYWAVYQDAEAWYGPFDSEPEAVADGIRDGCRQCVWVAPVNAELDDEDAFFDALADHLLVWGVENAEETLVEDGWLDPEDSWKAGEMLKDRDRILAKALQEVLGPRPYWRQVDTSKARRVDL